MFFLFVFLFWLKNKEKNKIDIKNAISKELLYAETKENKINILEIFYDSLIKIKDSYNKK